MLNQKERDDHANRLNDNIRSKVAENAVFLRYMKANQKMIDHWERQLEKYCDNNEVTDGSDFNIWNDNWNP